MKTLFVALGHELRVSKKGYVELLRNVSTEVVPASCDSEVAVRKSADQEEELAKLEVDS